MMQWLKNAISGYEGQEALYERWLNLLVELRPFLDDIREHNQVCCAILVLATSGQDDSITRSGF